MKIYFANMFGVKGLGDYLRNPINILAAYPFFKNKSIDRPSHIDNLFIDSGAFGKNSGDISLDSYIDFIQEYKKEINLYANLDVIGDPQKSYLNLLKIQKQGLDPLPVFHYKSSFKWLDRLLDYEYIALGGLVPIAGNYTLMRFWLDKVWDYIYTKAPNIKVHGFGIQNLDIMRRYPWYSVDSSSVHIVARYGGIYTPSGALKINPAVNSRELSWQLRKPTALLNIKKHVEKYLDNYSFEEARESSNKGILCRSVISIHYLLEEFEDFKCDFKTTSNNLIIKQ